MFTCLPRGACRLLYAVVGCRVIFVTLLALVPALSAGSESHPVQPLRAVVQIGTGIDHSCAVTTGGGVICWGRNDFGQLGDGTTEDRSTPVNVAGLSGGVSAISVGSAHTCAITSAGGVKCWGYNGQGRLGDGSTIHRSIPVDVVGLSEGVDSVTTGSQHTCALTSGAIKCWGWNIFGQLGDGTTEDRSTPVDVTGLSDSVSAISAGDAHSCALGAAGGLECWGNNNYGQLGDGSIDSRPVPRLVEGLGGGVDAVSGGGSHTCALLSAGALKCWGSNRYGELGDGSTDQRPTPVDVLGLSEGITAISSGTFHTCAVTSDRRARCWGSNLYGELGDGSRTGRLAPVDVVGLELGVGAISASMGHSCALTTEGGVKCWGYNVYGQLGDNSKALRETPTTVDNLPAQTDAVSGGDEHTCSVAGGWVSCWGSNSYGQIGQPDSSHTLTPVDVAGLGSDVIHISAGGAHSCALSNSDGVQCWGRNDYGQLGDGSRTGTTTPVVVAGLESGIIMIGAGGFHSCALTAAGGVKCWGRNDRGTLGNGNRTSSSTPVDVIGLTSGVVEISVGRHHSCARTSNAGVVCWGFNGEGQIGHPNATFVTSPYAIPGLSSSVRAIRAGGRISCALTTDGAVMCWGSGPVGDGTFSYRDTPVGVDGLDSGVTAIAVGGDHACALTAFDAVKCWGENGSGQLGDGTVIDGLSPVEIGPLGSDITALTAGNLHTCALTKDGELSCWGSHLRGQLGVGGRDFALPGDVLVSTSIFRTGFE